MLSEIDFNVLNCIIKKTLPTERDIADCIGISCKEVTDQLALLKMQGYIEKEENSITESGLAAMKPYKVQNAIILAAGFASRCAPLSYERPKGLFVIKGEVLIERQIKQLLDKGIREIYVVVGYKKELFYYLAEKFGIQIVVNTEYDIRNNLSSIMAAKQYLGNSYICYSDNYLNSNGFEQYVYHSYYAAMYSRGYTDEYVIKFDRNGLIKQYYQGDTNSWYQMGEMYFNRETSEKFLSLMEKEYVYPSIYNMKIDDFYIRHLSEFDIYIKKYPDHAFMEFDTISDIKSFDSKFVQNMGENILTIICEIFHCTDDEITNVQQIKRGMTNTIFSFECRGEKYIYRHPGIGTSKIINRENEAYAQRMALKLDLDPSLVACDPQRGWKICRFIENVPFSYADDEDIEIGIDLIRKMHSGVHIELGWSFNMIERAEEIQNKISPDYYDAYGHFSELRMKATKLYERILEDNVPFEMCHNDTCANNILIGKTRSYLIDWEYAGDNDPASDIASFIINYDFSSAKVDWILERYFARTLTNEEKAHYYGFIAISAYFYFSWAIYMESSGNNVGNFSYLCFNYATKYIEKAFSIYNEIGE